MTRQHARTTSQMLAASVTLAVVLIMLTPLRRGPVANPVRQAGWIPLLNLEDMTETVAFRCLNTAPTHFAASAEPLARQPSASSVP
ncbi:MAG: hypothetical protein B7Z37_14805 [Verrucomicrobia bacterium 12-59-8]|nr:MAG: hypothetical protein B7Z37_14805 [Verrucomicrobia bacterium 12-59-8]